MILLHSIYFSVIIIINLFFFVTDVTHSWASTGPNCIIRRLCHSPLADKLYNSVTVCFHVSPSILIQISNFSKLPAPIEPLTLRLQSQRSASTPWGTHFMRILMVRIPVCCFQSSANQTKRRRASAIDWCTCCSPPLANEKTTNMVNMTSNSVSFRKWYTHIYFNYRFNYKFKQLLVGTFFAFNVLGFYKERGNGSGRA